METIEKETLELDKDGYLKNAAQWTPELAREWAGRLGIDLTEKHFDVLNWLRTKQAEGVALSIRKVGSSGLVDIKQFYELFPGGPLKIASKLAGIPKPVSCI